MTICDVIEMIGSSIARDDGIDLLAGHARLTRLGAADLLDSYRTARQRYEQATTHLPGDADG